MNRPLLCFALYAFAWSAPAQTLAPELEVLDDHFKGDVRFRVDAKSTLLMDHYNEYGRYRQDRAPLAAIDSVTWSEAEQAIAFHCGAQEGPCMEMELFRQHTIRRTRTIILGTALHPTTGEHLLELIRAVLRANDTNTEDGISETRTRDLRMR